MPAQYADESHSYSVSLPTYDGASFDASTTNLTYRLDATNSSDSSIRVTLSFLSPITPTSTLRQSMPAAYMAVYVSGTCNVSIYTDVNGEWVSGDHGEMITWDLQDAAEPLKSKRATKSWTIQRQTEQLFTETNDRAEWGTLWFTGPGTAHHQAGSSAGLRRQFAEHGHLSGNIDQDFRAVMDDEPVFAFSKTFSWPTDTDPGPKDQTPERCAIFTLALAQNPVVQFASARGLTYMRPLWASYIPRTQDMIGYHYHDFQTASILAHDYSEQLKSDARTSGSENYEDIVALSARQVLGATQFSGTPDNPILFLKEISSNGNFQTVDVIFPAFPFFLYTNPLWLAYLLEPLLEHQLSLQYPNDYSMHDIGTHFPNATGHPDGDDEYMPVEECGDMLIMGLALVNALRDETHATLVNPASPCHDRIVEPLAPKNEESGYLTLAVDGCGMDESAYLTGGRGRDVAKAWVLRTYRLWKQWTGYLVREALIPRNQLCTDDFAGWLANQTNLALKGIIGIRAMSEISELAGEEKDARYYKNVSISYVDQWQEFGISRDGTHAKLAYTWYGSWTTIYNLYADALLCFHLPGSSDSRAGQGQKPLGPQEEGPFVPQRVYSMQSTFYRAVLQRYGLPLDSRHLYTKSDWEFFAAAVTSRKTSEAIVDSIALWVNETVTGEYAR